MLAPPMSVGGGVWAWWGAGAESSPDHRKEDGIATDTIHQKEKPIVADTLLTGLDDVAGHAGQHLWGRSGVVGLPPVCRRAHLLPTRGPRRTCFRIMIPKILSNRTYLTRDQLELMKAMVMKLLQPGGRGGVW